MFERFLTFGDGPTDAIMVDNADWLDALEYIPFLREVGQHFSVNRMLSFDSVKLRLDREQSLTFLEFNYMILQAYDFLRAVAARRLPAAARRLGPMGQYRQRHRAGAGGWTAPRSIGVTTPLITTADGGKMGKTEKGAVWLNADQLSPYDYWQFWRNTQDADVGKFLRLFTDLPLDEIARLEALEGAEINDAKKALADAATAMLHGEDAAAAAAETARKTFEEGAAGGDLPTLQGRRRDRPGRRAGRPRLLRVEERGAAADRARRRAGGRRGGRRRIRESRSRRQSHLGRQEEARPADVVWTKRPTRDRREQASLSSAPSSRQDPSRAQAAG